MTYSIDPIGFVHSTRKSPDDDNWDNEQAHIELHRDFTAEAFLELDCFSHVEVVYLMHLVLSAQIETGSRHPRERDDLPLSGIFAQRGRNRPNRIGITRCRIVKVEGNRLYLEGLDAIDGTPVVDIKPWISEFGPRGEVFQPDWVGELMRDYWQK